MKGTAGAGHFVPAPAAQGKFPALASTFYGFPRPHCQRETRSGAKVITARNAEQACC